MRTLDLTLKKKMLQIPPEKKMLQNSPAVTLTLVLMSAPVISCVSHSSPRQKSPPVVPLCHSFRGKAFQVFMLMLDPTLLKKMLQTRARWTSCSC